MILIGTDEGIYRWSEGSGWPAFHSLQDRAVVGLECPSPGVLIALDRAGDLLESTDHGMTWRAVPLPESSGRPSALAIAGSPPEVLVAVKPLGLYRRLLGKPLPREALPRGSGLVPDLVERARSLAGSATALLSPPKPKTTTLEADAQLRGWEPLTAPAPPQTTVPPVVRVVAATSSGWFAAVSAAGLWRSTDLGRSWSQCPGLPAEVYALRTVPGRPGQLWAATGDGCRLSPDGGVTWEDRSAGLENTRQVRAVEIKPDAPDTLLAGAAPASSTPAAPRQGLEFALFESNDSGKSWTKVVKRNFPESLEYDTIVDIRFDPAATENILVALGTGELWVTRNGGAYWGPLARQIRAARVLCAVK